MLGQLDTLLAPQPHRFTPRSLEPAVCFTTVMRLEDLRNPARSPDRTPPPCARHLPQHIHVTTACILT